MAHGAQDDPRPRDTAWSIGQSFDMVFAPSLDAGQDGLVALYEKGKQRQWDAATRIDWSPSLDPDNPQLLPFEVLPIAGMGLVTAMSQRDRMAIFRHYQAWSVSQFLHGGRGRCCAPPRS